VTPKIKYQIELAIYALEAGNTCAHDMGGDFGEDYYVYFEELFEQTLNKLNKTEMTTQLQDEIDLILKGAFEGYDHKDTLEDKWTEYKGN
jgi:hypothetical protein